MEWQCGVRERSALSALEPWAAPMQSTSPPPAGACPATTSMPAASGPRRGPASRSCPTSSTLAKTVPVIILSLPHPDALATTVAEITKDKLPAKTIVETSTFRIEDKQRAEQALRKAGHVTLDCPVSGTGAQAAVKDIVIYASGDKKAIARLEPDVRRILPRRL